VSDCSVAVYRSLRSWSCVGVLLSLLSLTSRAAAGEMVVVERPWSQVVSRLPPPMFLAQYGM
jgi:hypothetical protein